MGPVVRGVILVAMAVLLWDQGAATHAIVAAEEGARGVVEDRVCIGRDWMDDELRADDGPSSKLIFLSLLPTSSPSPVP